MIGRAILRNMACVPPVSLILLPGLDGTGLLFQPLVAALTAEITPIIVRFPGDRHLTYDELLPFALAAQPPSGPFILLGESFSGPLAAMLAAKRPERLIGLILCASFVARPRRWVHPAVQLLARGPVFQLYPLYKRLRARIGGFASPQTSAAFDEIFRQVQPGVIASRVRMVFDVDARDALRACNVPMLYLQGGKDHVVPHRNLGVIQQINPAIQVVTIGSSHMVLQRHAVAAARAIATFANSLAAN